MKSQKSGKEFKLNSRGSRSLSRMIFFAFIPLSLGMPLWGQEKASFPGTKRVSKLAASSGIYRQQMRVNYTTSDGFPASSTNCVVVDNAIYVATEKGIAKRESGQWSLVLPTNSPVAIVSSAKGRVVFNQENQIVELVSTGKSKVLATVAASLKLTAIVVADAGIYVGTSGGLFVIQNGNLAAVAAVNHRLASESEIRQIAVHGDEVVVAAAGGLISYADSTKVATALMPRTKDASWAPYDVRGVGFDSNGQLWFASLQGVGQRTKEGWTLYTGTEGLPYNDFTCLAAGPNSDVWFGTRIGAIHFTGKRWEYRQGKRWLADDEVKSIAISPSGDAWLATAAGLTCIESRPATLREKAAFLNEEIDQHHRRTPYGYVDAIHLEKAGDKSKGVQHDSDNDGLWTSMYGAAQCFEYAVTKSAESKKRANNAFRAVAFLSEVPQGGEHSPPVGFPARTILPVSGRNPNDHDSPEHDRQRQQRDPLWKVITPRWPLSADKQWYWKTDTSSDELDGHYFFYALYHDLVAETDEEKKYVKAVVDRVTSHLIDHDYTLIDHDGKPTRWGQFSPSVLNTDYITDCRGLNSVSVLSYILVAAHVTGDPKYRQHYESLLYKHNYFTNVLSPKYQNGPGSGNQSDDEMAFMCYYTLLAYEHDPKLRHQYQRSMARYFHQEVSEDCPLFNLIFANFYEHVRYHYKETPLSIVEDSVQTLQKYPYDRIHWGYKNSHRLDIVPLGSHVIESDGKGHLRNGKVLPIDEQFVNHWNHDPWRLDDRHNGGELCDGTSYLLPYWLGVHHGLIKESAISASQK